MVCMNQFKKLVDCCKLYHLMVVNRMTFMTDGVVVHALHVLLKLTELSQSDRVRKIETRPIEAG